ncbi:MAG: M56 family metallopeptidase [Barnesiella sp.]|nr:M56 family metallopeptidase [Barnesiella sp.]
MSAVFLYSIFSSVSLLMLWGVWTVAVGHIARFSFDRRILLAIYVIALIIWPLSEALLRLTHVSSAVEVRLPAVIPVAAPGGAVEGSYINIIVIVMMAYYIAAALTALYFIYGSVRVLLLRRRTETIVLPSGIKAHIITGDFGSPFSFMGEIYLPAAMTGGENERMLLLHESAHVRLHHWVDLLLAHMVCVLQWYNPAAWKMLKAIKRLHEFEADARVISSGIDRRSYQLLLLKTAVAPSYSTITDNFNQSSLKSRIIMMQTPSPSPLRRLRALSIIPAATLAFVAVQLPAAKAFASEVAIAAVVSSANESAATLAGSDTVDKSPAAHGTNAEVYDHVEVIPEFPGGITALFDYLKKNINYPKSAMESGMEGRVVTRFVVSANGKVSDAEIIKSVAPELDAEALRVVNSLPDFTPGYNDGTPVACYFVLPVMFKLDSENKIVPAPSVFVDGKLYKGSAGDIAPETIERIDVIKNDPQYPNGKVMITLKK